METMKLEDYSLAKAAEELVRDRVLEIVSRVLPVAMREAEKSSDGTIQSREVDRNLYIILGYGQVLKWLRSVRDTAPKITAQEMRALMERLHTALENDEGDSIDLLDELFGADK